MDNCGGVNMAPAWLMRIQSEEIGVSYTYSRAPFVANGFRDILGFGILRFVVVPRNGIHLAGGLVLGEVEFFLDFVLTAAQVLKPLFVLKGSADFGFEFLAPPVGIGDVGFQLGGTFLEALNGRFQ